ncbi:MerR family transcriptional regulator [Salinisphaera sp. T31B1]|uniref:MerR family transcriptional regulator n=1 Tax=Salinisphaera sp. T31B1 TaxID=727963 RepID=UPI003340B0F1
MLTISEAARRAGCSASAIRYYERAGLLPPPYRGHNGYRYYHEREVERLGFVTRARALGFPVSAVADLLCLADHPEAPCDSVDRLLAHQLSDVDMRLDRLQCLRMRLAELQSVCAGGHPMRDCGILAALGGDGPPDAAG